MRNILTEHCGMLLLVVYLSGFGFTSAIPY